MHKLKELRQKVAALVTEERSQLERMKKDGLTFEGTENTQYEARAADIAKLEAEIQGLEQVESRSTANKEHEERLSQLNGKPEKTAGNGSASPDDEVRMNAHRRHIRGGARNLSEVEVRALTVGTNTEGGYLGMPLQAVSEIIQAVDNEVFVRQLATVIPVGNSEGIGVPTLDTDVNDADWTAELLTGSEDTALRFGKRELRPHPLAKRIKISNKLIRSSVIDVVSFVNGRFGYKFGVTLEKGYMTGNGTQQPLGIFTADANGIPTSRDVSTGNSTTAIAADNLIEVKHTLKSQYWSRPSLRWIFHQDAVKQIRKLKDGQGQYLWQQGLSADLPSRILEVPYLLSQYAPNTFTTGLYVGIIGDFKFYWIADSNQMQMQVLDQLYAETNQMGYIARAESDGMPVLAEAFARVKLA